MERYSGKRLEKASSFRLKIAYFIKRKQVHLEERDSV